MTSPDVERLCAELHDEAMRRTGLSDFGPKDYREPFEMLVAHLAGSEMTEMGRATQREDFVSALIARLVREDEWKKNPGYRNRVIKRPLVICGIPRTGTTALHKLLSVDPQFQGLDNWLTYWPKPRPPRDQWPEEKGYQNAVQALERLSELVPSMRIAHEVVADEVDECNMIFRLDFNANKFPVTLRIPEYDEWFQQQDETLLYHRLADTLRLIGLHDDRTWLLKNPAHFGQLAALFDAFPDARVIITHRDPVKSIASLCSLVSGMRQMLYKHPRLTELGPRELAFWRRARERTEAVRRSRSAEQILDIDHRQFHVDPMGTVRQIYRHFALELAPETARAMETWLAANPAGKLGEHRYKLEDYGVTEQQVRDALGEG